MGPAPSSAGKRPGQPRTVRETDIAPQPVVFGAQEQERASACVLLSQHPRFGLRPQGMVGQGAGVCRQGRQFSFHIFRDPLPMGGKVFTVQIPSEERLHIDEECLPVFPEAGDGVGKGPEEQRPDLFFLQAVAVVIRGQPAPGLFHGFFTGRSAAV